MFVLWLTVLVIYGLVVGWHDIHPLFWWLLVVFFVQQFGKKVSRAGRNRLQTAPPVADQER